MKNKKKTELIQPVCRAEKRSEISADMGNDPLIFSAYLLSDSEILGNVKQQARPDTWSMADYIGLAGGSF